MPSWHGAIPVQKHDEVPGFFKERGPNWWKQRSLGSSVSGHLCCPQIPASEATRVDWRLLRAGAGNDQKGLHPLSLVVWERAEDQGKAAGLHKEIWEPFLSSTYTHTHTLGFSWLSGTTVASADAWWSMFDTNIISPPQFAYHELKLYLRISLIQERTSPLLSWDTAAVGSLIPTGVGSSIKKKKKKALWRLPALNANQTHP